MLKTCFKNSSLIFTKKYRDLRIINTRTYKTLNMKLDKLTPILHIDHSEAKSLAAELIIKENIIALPTDTVYGLACNANSPDAIKKLYEIKDRDEMKPVAICVSSLEELRKWGDATHLPDALLQNLLPGAVTIVLEKTSLLDNPYLNPHTTKIGIRIPDYKFIQDVCNICKIPVALTSANRSSVPSSLSVQEFEPLFSKLGAIFDGGILGDGRQETRIGSTVVDLSVIGFYDIIRRGISYKQTAELLESFNLYSTHS